ncbi:MAG: ECF-type sigma factor [Bryobacteraceae bacterium]|nr:ECF-type sigma factor [Bryobacteraceae bacterium]
MARLFPLIYEELLALARKFLRAERHEHTLNATALVHEAYLRLCAGAPPRWVSRSHFVGVVATAMRHVLIDYARSRAAAKRSASIVPLDADLPVAAAAGVPEDEMLAIGRALEKLSHRDPRLERIVELRYFAGLSIAQVAEVLCLSPTTVKADWLLAKAWLRREVSGVNEGSRS